MKRIWLLLFVLTILFSLVACDQNVSKENNTNSSGTEHVPTPTESVTTPIEQPQKQAISIVGTWHYEMSGQDCYIAFYEDGTGWIHYYQDYGQYSGLTGYVNKGIRKWSYSAESQSLGITIAGGNIAGINTDKGPFGYIVAELTETTLIIKKNGAYDSSVPMNRELARGKPQSLPHISD